MKLKKTISIIIEKAQILGLNELDVKNAKELLEYNEPWLSFDTVLTQMYEDDTKIDQEFYDMAITIITKMNLQIDKYSFLKDLLELS